jgi:hypothetical protein
MMPLHAIHYTICVSRRLERWGGSRAALDSGGKMSDMKTLNEYERMKKLLNIVQAKWPTPGGKDGTSSITTCYGFFTQTKS